MNLWVALKICKSLIPILILFFIVSCAKSSNEKRLKKLGIINEDSTLVDEIFPIIEKIKKYNNLTMFYRHKGVYDSAFHYAYLSVKTAEKNKIDSPVTADVYYTLGLLYKDYAQIDSSEKYLLKALGKREKLTGKNSPEVGDIFNNLGVLYYLSKDYSKAEKYFKNALRLRKKRGKFHKSLFGTYLNLGNLYKNRRKFRKSFVYYDSALVIAKKNFGKDNPQTAYVLINMAVLANERGIIDSSVIYNKRALKILEKNYPEGHPNIAVIYNNLGTGFLYSRDFEKAEKYFIKSIEIKKRMNANFKINFANNYYNLAESYYYLKKYDKAEKYYTRSISLYAEISGENGYDCLFSKLQLGKVYSAINKPMECYEITKKVVRTINFNKFTFFENGILLHQAGMNFYSVNKFDDAKKCFEKANNYFDKLNLPVITKFAENYYYLGKIFIESKKFHNSLKAIQKGIGLFNKKHSEQNYFTSDELTVLANLYYLRGKVLFSIFSDDKNSNFNNLQKASENLDSAIFIYDSQLKKIQFENSKIGFENEIRKTVDLAIKISFLIYSKSKLKKDFEKALNLAEKSKATLVLQKLSDSEIKNKLGVSDSLLEKEKSLLAKFYYYSRLLEESKPEDSVAIANYKEILLSVSDEISNLNKEIRERFPRYSELFYENRKITIEEINRKIIAQGRDLVDYYLTSENLYAFVITKDTITIIRKNLPVDFENLVRKTLRNINNSDYNNFTTNSYKLYSILFSDVDSIISERRCSIIPDGILNFISFDFLLYDDKFPKVGNFRLLPYLVKKYAFGYSISLRNLLQNANVDTVRNFLSISPGM